MKPKYEMVADEIRQTALGMSPGQRLPSIRDLGRSAGVSQFTVQRAIDLLEREGYVTRRSAIGVYSARPQGKGTASPRLGKPRIVVLVPQGWTYQMPELIRAALAERGFLSHIHFYNLADPPGRWLPRIRCEGVILIGWCQAETLAGLRSRRIPFVAQGTQYIHLPVDHTCGDERLSGALAAEHLLGLGHRRLAVLVNEPQFPDVAERLRGFVSVARMRGVEPVVYDCGTRIGEDACAKARDLLDRELSAGRPAWTALYSISGVGAMAALGMLYRRGIRVPQEVSVIGGDERPESEYLCPPLTTVGFDLAARARGLAEILERRFAGDTSPRIQKMFDPFLISRASTAPPAEGN